MKPSRILLLLFSFLFSCTLSATTYYLDASGGANNQNGLSPQTAWKDLFKIRGSIPEPGDTFLLKRGEQWSGAQLYLTTSGDALNPIVFSDYGATTDSLPIISLTGTVALSDITTSWTEGSSNIWEMPFTKSIGRLFVDGIELLRADSTDMVGLNDSEGLFGHWYFDRTTNKFYLYATSNPAATFSTIEGGITASGHIDAILVDQSDYLLFENLDIRGGARASLSLFGCQHITVRKCKIGNAANSGVLIINSTISGIETSMSSSISVDSNIIDSHFSFFHGLGTERGCGDGVKLFDGATNCIISNNIFKNWAHNAVELLAIKTEFTGVNNNKIHDNYITAPDIPYSHPLGADGSIGLCQQNEFFRNTIENCRTTSQINGNNNHVHHNIIKNIGNSPAKDVPAGFAFTLGVYGSTLVSQNNIFEHNLIINTAEAAFRVIGFGFSQFVENNIIRNNIFYETGQSPHNNSYQAGTGLYIHRRGGVNGNSYENNLFFSSINNAKAVYKEDDMTYHTAMEFNQLNGVNDNIIIDNLTGNPLFVDLPNNDYHLLEPSPGVNAGKSTNLLVDFDLNNRTIGVQPDIGPYETTFIACPFDRIINQNTILSYTYTAQNTITSAGTISAMQDVIFKAGTSITFKDGFTINAGGDLHAYIENCMPASIKDTNKKYSQLPTKLLPEVPNKIILKIVPNPAYHTATISFDSKQSEKVKLLLYNVTGQVFWEKENYQTTIGNNEQSIDVSQLSQGIYFLSLQAPQQLITKKIIVRE